MVKLVTSNVWLQGEVRTQLVLDGDTYFTDALATDASENENISVSRNKITIKTITIHSAQNLNYRLWFYSKDAFGADDVLGYIDLNLPTSGVTKVIAATTYYMYSVTDVELPIEDADGTLELHLQLENKSATSKNAGATGKVQMTMFYGVNS